MKNTENVEKENKKPIHIKYNQNYIKITGDNENEFKSYLKTKEIYIQIKSYDGKKILFLDQKIDMNSFHDEYKDVKILDNQYTLSLPDEEEVKSYYEFLKKEKFEKFKTLKEVFFEKKARFIYIIDFESAISNLLYITNLATKEKSYPLEIAIVKLEIDQNKVHRKATYHQFIDPLDLPMQRFYYTMNIHGINPLMMDRLTKGKGIAEIWTEMKEFMGVKRTSDEQTTIIVAKGIDNEKKVLDWFSSYLKISIGMKIYEFVDVLSYFLEEEYVYENDVNGLVNDEFKNNLHNCKKCSFHSKKKSDFHCCLQGIF
jgi:hypothetical protein